MNLKRLSLKEVEKFVNYWLDNSDSLCDCCNNYHYIKDCKGKDCPDYYKLTDEEVALKGYIQTHCWDCTNTDDFEFCKVVQESPCYDCTVNNNPLPNIDWNGKVE